VVESHAQHEKLSAMAPQLTVGELEAAVKDIASYKRPNAPRDPRPRWHPAASVAKTDYMACKHMGEEIAAKLRAEGGRDA
jgi:hypothetical protein